MKRWVASLLPHSTKSAAWLGILAALGISGLALAGWMLDIAFLKSIRPEWIPMKVVTALCVASCAGALALIHKDSPGVFERRAAQGLGAVVILVGLQTLAVYFIERHSGNGSSSIGQAPLLSLWLAPANRMAALTAMIFVDMGCVLALLAAGGRRAAGLAHAFILPVTVASYLVPVTYLFGVQNLHGFHNVPMALNAGLAFCALCFAVFCMSPDTWLMRVFTVELAGSRVARQLLPVLFLLPLGIGWLRIHGERAGFYRSEVGVILVALAYTFCLLAFVWFSAQSVNRRDEAARQKTDRLGIMAAAARLLLTNELPEQVVNTVCEMVMRNLDCQVFFNFLIEDGRERLQLSAYAGIPEAAAKDIRYLDFGSAVCGCVARDGCAIIAEDIPHTPDERTDLVRSFGVQAYASHPLVYQGRIVGTLSFGTRNRPRFSAEELEFMKAATALVATAMARKQAGEALRQSEQGLKRSQEIAHLGNWELDLINHHMYWSDEVYRIFGFKPWECAATYANFLDCVHPDDRAAVDSAYYSSLRESRDAYELEHRVMRRSTGEVRVVQEKCQHVRDDSGRIVRSLGMVHDVTELKEEEDELRRLNRTLQAHARVDQAVLRSTDEAAYLREVCRIIVEGCGHAMVWIGYAQDDPGRSVRPAAHSGFAEGYIETLNVTWADTERGRGPTGTAIRTGRPYICRDMLSDPLFQPWRAEAVNRGYASSAVMPLLEDGKAFGAISIYSRERDPFSEPELQLLSDIAADVARGIATFRLRAARAKAELARAQLAAIVESSQDAIIAKTLAGVITSWNGGAEKLYGYTAQEAVGKPVSMLLPPGREDEPADLLQRIAAGKTVLPYETVRRGKDGRDIEVFLTVSAIKNERGEVVGASATAHDISERKRAEVLTRARLRMLEASDPRVVSIDDAMRTALDEIEAQTGSRISLYHFVEADQQTLSLQNWSTSTLKTLCTAEGKGSHYPVAQAGVWADCLRERRAVIHNDYAALPHRKGLPPGHAPVSRELVVPISRGGRIVAIIGVGNKPTPYDEADVKVISLLGDFSWEIIERKRLESAERRQAENVAAYAARMEAANKELEAFSYSVSHDLRAPLRHINGFVELLHKKLAAGLDQQGRHYLKAITDSAKRMGTLIDDLLTFSRIGKSAMHMTAVDLESLVRQIREEVQDDAPGRDIEWAVAQLPPVQGDPSLLRIVLNNLLSNAVKFTRQRERAKIVIGARRSDSGETEVFVRDNGAGFDMRYYDKLFGVFQRLHRSEEFEGTGIGLATVRRIIARHEGRVWAEGALGEGASFYFSLPSNQGGRT